MAERMHAFQGRDEIREKETKKQKQKQRAAGKKLGYGKTEVRESDVEKWDMVSFFALHVDVRHKLLDSAERSFKELRIEARGQKAAAQVGKLDRRIATKEAEGKTQMTAAANFAKYLKVTRATSIAQLTRMLKGEKGKDLSNTAKVSVLRGQIQIRKYVNRVSQPCGPGSWLSGKCVDGDLDKLEEMVRDMVKRERYKPLPVIKVPAAMPRVTPHHADPVRRDLDQQENERVARVQSDFDAMVKNGTFLALLARKPRSSKEKPARTANQPRQSKGKERREPSAPEAAMVGSQFEDDAIEWVVLKVQWDDNVAEMAVFYYDKVAVESSEVDVDDLDDESESN
jgi:hypothetical protein